MSNIQKFAAQIPETFFISNMKTVRSNYPLLDRGNGSTLQRTIEFTDGTACSINVPSTNEAIKAAIASIHSGDCFRIAFKGIALPKEKKADEATTTPSGMPLANQNKSGGYKVQEWYQSPIVVWSTYEKAEVGALYKDVELPDFSDRTAVKTTVLEQKTTDPVQPSSAAVSNDEGAF